MSEWSFSREEKAIIVTRIKSYFRDKLDQELGQFDAEFLLDFFTQQIGAYYYNRGLYDARSVLESRLAAIDEALFDIEKPTEFTR